MHWFSILPDNLSVVEGWIKSFFIFMALFTVGPWAIFLVYDVVLYFWRAVAYQVPVVGGRARGRQRPRAPTLTERPDGETRTLGLIKIPTLDGGDELPSLRGDESVDSVTRRKAAKLDHDTLD